MYITYRSVFCIWMLGITLDIFRKRKWKKRQKKKKPWEKPCLASLDPPTENSPTYLSLAPPQSVQSSPVVYPVSFVLSVELFSHFSSYTTCCFSLRITLPLRQELAWMWITEHAPDWNVMWSSCRLRGDRKSHNVHHLYGSPLLDGHYRSLGIGRKKTAAKKSETLWFQWRGSGDFTLSATHSQSKAELIARISHSEAAVSWKCLLVGYVLKNSI